MAPNGVNGRKLWWTPALALTLTCTVLGATSWIVDTKLATLKEEVKGFKALGDERFKHVQRDLSDIKADMREILRLLKG